MTGNAHAVAEEQCVMTMGFVQVVKNIMQNKHENKDQKN